MRLSNLVVVGASLAGLRAVEALRRRGYDGRITWVGDELRLPYDRPPLSKQVLRGEWSEERVALKADYAALEVDLRLGCRATSLDPRERHLNLNDGAALSYDGLVVATGARPKLPPWARGASRIHALRTLDDALAIRRALDGSPRVAIVGAGFIGLEVAASVRALGLDVTVIDVAEVPLAHALGGAMGAALADYHRDHGVLFRTGVGVARPVGGEALQRLELTDGTSVRAELVVVGIGVTPETTWLDGSGVATNDGVLCDAQFATSVPDVFACGDVVRFDHPIFGESMKVEHWTNAVEQANAAIARLLDGPAAPAPRSVPYFWSDQYDLKLQFAGRTKPGDDVRVVEGSVEGKDLVAIYGHAGVLCGALTVNKPGALVKYRRAITDRAAFG
jgi:3-phenylpropionate/trans-cinnamate dioxygenase ferredoxin reductase subunit